MRRTSWEQSVDVARVGSGFFAALVLVAIYHSVAIRRDLVVYAHTSEHCQVDRCTRRHRREFISGPRLRALWDGRVVGYDLQHILGTRSHVV